MNEIFTTKYEDGDEELHEYDEKGYLVYHKDIVGDEFWYENGNEVHYKSHNGAEVWLEHDKNNNVISHKISDGREYFYKYKEKIEYVQVEISKREFLKMTKKKEAVNRFDLMEWDDE